MDDRLLNYCKTAARLHHRSLSQEILSVLEASTQASGPDPKNATLEFLSLNGAWKDPRCAEELIQDLKDHRTSGARFRGDPGLFD